MVPGSGVRDVQVGVLEVGVDTDNVSGLLGNKGENVGSNIVTSKSGESPVGTDGGDLGVVVVVVVVSGSVKGLVNGSSKEDGENLVLGGVGVVLVEGDEDEGVLGVRQRQLLKKILKVHKTYLHEVGVVQEGVKKVASPLSGNGDGRVVTVRGHVGGDEHPLGKLLVLDILPEDGGVLDESETVFVGGNGVEDDQRVVLANVHVRLGLLVDPLEGSVSSVGHVLLVLSPRDLSGIKNIGNGGDVLGDLEVVVVVNTKVVSSNSGDVVTHGRVGNSKVVGKGDTLSG